MKTKHRLASVMAMGIFGCLPILNSNADIIGDDAFLIAENVIAGIGKDGAFGSVSPIPASVFPVQGIGGNRIGYLSDPSRQGFSGSFDGDFFFPGFPEEGWGIRVNNKNYNNNKNEQKIEIPGGLSNFKTNDRFSSVEWNGIIDRLEIRKTFRTYNKGLGIIMDVEMTNASATDMTNVYFMRTVDPDNNQANFINATGTFETTNRILLQGDEDSLSAVSASQADNSLLTLSGYSKNSRVTYGLQEVRDPVAVYNGTGELKQSGSFTGDIAVSVAFKFDEILAGETVSFTHSYALASLVIPNVELDPDNSSGSKGGSFKQVYMLGNTGVPIVDDDVTITHANSQLLEGLKVKLTNPMSGDLITITDPLPANTMIDSDETNNDTEITIKGVATIDEYISLIKSIRFENQNQDASLKPRELVVQVIDDTFILSNSNVADIFITVPLVIDPNIAGDNILSQPELKDELKISGTAAPNADLKLVLTDSDNHMITENLVVKSDGSWSINIESSQLPGLAEGTIKVNAEATDTFSNKTTGDAEFTKDTAVQLTITSPADQTVVTRGETVIRGDTDPNAEITVTTIDGKECKTVADAEGKWSCTLTGLEKGKKYPLSVLAKDELANEATETLEIEVNSIGLDINSPAYEAIAEDSTPIIKGKTEPNLEVTLTTEFGKVCNTKSDAAGNWSCELDPMPTGGPHDLTVLAKDLSSNKEAVLPWRVAIPNIGITIAEPALNAIVDDKTPVIKGSTSPNLEITIITEFGTECKTTADANGDWSCELDELPSGGPYDLDVTAKDPLTNSEITTPWRVGVLKNTLEVIEPIENEEITESPVIVTGKTKPNAEVTVEEPGGQKCTTFADDAGEWTCELENLVSGDDQELKVTSETEGGIKEVVTRRINVTIDDGVVKTALNGGAGSFNSPLLLLIFSLLFTRKNMRKNIYFSKY